MRGRCLDPTVRDKPCYPFPPDTSIPRPFFASALCFDLEVVWSGIYFLVFGLYLMNE